MAVMTALTDPACRFQTLYDSFISARDKEERSASRDVASDKPRQGNTVYVRGFGVNEQLLRRAFHKFGAIVNISMEIEKKYRAVGSGCGCGCSF